MRIGLLGLKGDILGIYGGFPKISGTFGVSIIRMMIYWGLYWGPPILENYHIGIMEENMETTI